MPKLVKDRIQDVRNALGTAGKGLSPGDWLELLEEIAADIEGHIEAVKEENDLA